MRLIVFTALLLAVACPFCWSGEIYGNISDGVRPIQGARVTIQSRGTPTAVSDANGSYKVYVPAQGKFYLTLLYGRQTLSIPVFSYPQSVRYDLILENRGGTFSLRRK